jgi:hypothetical protein
VTIAFAAEQAQREEGNILETALGKGTTEKIIGTTQKLTNVVTKVASHGDSHLSAAPSLPSRAPVSDNFFDEFGDNLFALSGRKISSGSSVLDTVANGISSRHIQENKQVPAVQDFSTVSTHRYRNAGCNGC